MLGIGEISASFLENCKKMPWIANLWVKFPIQNTILKIFWK